MRPRTLGELASILGGEAYGDPGTVVGPDVVIDSRLVTPGALFVALPGEQVDGHDFVASAAASQAAAALTTRLVAGQVQLVVADAVTALATLAHHLITESSACSIAITGSSGKTSTKDILAQLLEAETEVVAPQGSFNNEIGVPLTACRIDDRTKYLISEMGARGLGHIASLCAITEPDIALVLNVGHAHLGEFGDQQTIAAAKGELVAAASQWVVLNSADKLVAEMATSRGDGVCLAWCGLPRRDGDLQVWAEEISLTANGGYRFTLHVGEESWPGEISLVGRHQVENAVAACAAAVVAGAHPAAVVRALAGVRPRSRWRMEMTTRADQVVIINDAYNANPDSMLAAFAAVAELVEQRREQWPTARSWAVLGDMLELGTDSEQAHRELGAQLADAGFEEVVSLGEHARLIADAATAVGLSARVAQTHAEAAAATMPAAGDIVLVKASRGLTLDKVAAALVEEVTSS